MDTLARNWWALALRGAIAIIFGIATFIWPGLTLAALILLFGAYMLVDGIFGIVSALTGTRVGPVTPGRMPRWALFLEGLLGVLAGIATLVWPGMTALVLLILIGVWSIATGIFEIVAAVQLRRVIQGEFFMALGGLLSILFGILVLVQPESGLLAIAWIIGSYAILFGILMIGLALRLRRQNNPGGGRSGNLTPA